ncbi:hypothetical protein RHSIM_Rhsim07G0101700 [Rhododendron simsii]|uniref:Maspardin n=1 Tax=Rhododendron simsii TaxID=118357 RepID=A0A834GM80_RHOSS|nr:hypothetical protein RHSIM_Rhsim07G0101700 [Rhododendron simsii]
MKGGFSVPGDYIYFKSQVPLHKIPVCAIDLLLLANACFLAYIGLKQWRYYDFGPKVVPPLVCIPGTAGTADVYYKQVMSLSMKGYRVISVDIPRVWNHHEWIQAFEKFLDAIDVHHVHLYGTSLGGLLAQLFAQHRPRRVRSLVLSNTFLETHDFAAAMPWAPVVGWAPSFLLKRHVLSGIRDGPHEPFIADSVDFVVSQVETLSKDDLASRLTLTADAASIGPLLLSDSFVTIMDLHLRRVGVEPQPDLVRGISQEASGSGGGGSGSGSDGDDGGSGSSGKQNEGKEDGDDAPKDGMGSSGVAPPESQPPPSPESSAPESPDSQLSDSQLLRNANLGSTGAEFLPLQLLPAIFAEYQYLIAAYTFLHFAREFCTLYLLPFYLATLYIKLDWVSCRKFRQAV